MANPIGKQIRYGDQAQVPQEPVGRDVVVERDAEDDREDRQDARPQPDFGLTAFAKGGHFG